MHFREAKLPIHLKVEQVTGEGAPELPSVTELRDSTMALIKLQEDYRAKAMQNIVRAQERQKKQYDRKHNTNTTLNVGDKVLKENSRNKHCMGGKLDNRWTGPFIIHEDLGKGRFRVKTSSVPDPAERQVPGPANSAVKPPVDPDDNPVESPIQPPVDDPDDVPMNRKRKRATQEDMNSKKKRVRGRNHSKVPKSIAFILLLASLCVLLLLAHLRILLLLTHLCIM